MFVIKKWFLFFSAFTLMFTLNFNAQRLLGAASPAQITCLDCFAKDLLKAPRRLSTSITAGPIEYIRPLIVTAVPVVTAVAPVIVTVTDPEFEKLKEAVSKVTGNPMQTAIAKKSLVDAFMLTRSAKPWSEEIDAIALTLSGQPKRKIDEARNLRNAQVPAAPVAALPAGIQPPLVASAPNADSLGSARVQPPSVGFFRGLLNKISPW